MPKNTREDIQTLGYVLRRTNYGEADRILNIITPLGKITAIAKGVRKSRSKLAGGIEMFSLTEFNIHRGRSEFGVVTGAKMLKYDGEILKDFTRMTLASEILQKISRVAESSDSPAYFEIVDQSLTELNSNTSAELVEGWFLLHTLVAMGEEANLYRDVTGTKLSADKTYRWDATQMAFAEDPAGEYGANEIKLLRLMATADLQIVKRVKLSGDELKKTLALARVAAKV